MGMWDNWAGQKGVEDLVSKVPIWELS